MLIAASSSPLLLLAVLACPVGMGVMMLFMGRGMMGGKKTAEPRGEGGSLADMKAEQARLADKISALEERQTPAAERAPDPVN
jgi:hypothetical protein